MSRNAPKLPPPSRPKAMRPIKRATLPRPPTSTRVPSRYLPANQCFTVIGLHVGFRFFFYEIRNFPAFNFGMFRASISSLAKSIIYLCRLWEGIKFRTSSFRSSITLPPSHFVVVCYSRLLIIANAFRNRLYQRNTPQVRPGYTRL